MAGELNKIHIAPRHEKLRRIIGKMQRSNFQFSRHDTLTTEMPPYRSRGRHRAGLASQSSGGANQGGGTMALHAETTVATRLVTHDKNTCPQCQAWLLAPDWSEYLNERCVRHAWSCESCGYEFETAVFFAPAEAVPA
jgi:ribosomal protein L37AE/L43A